MEEKTRELIAIIDTETNWHNEVMSVGIVLSYSDTYEPYDYRYYILTPEVKVGGMYSGTLFLKDNNFTKICSRCEAISQIMEFFEIYGVTKIFAYNGGFDLGHLPELSEFSWFDIIKIAAYKKYNKALPESLPCFSTGKIKSGYGVEKMIMYLTGKTDYRETHNALIDALDELQIIRLIDADLNIYTENAKIN